MGDRAQSRAQIEQSELNSTETEGREVFKYWGELVEKYWRTLGEGLVNMRQENSRNGRNFFPD